jgi:ABC-type nickel/cobalt efflux system permease component RcnA
VQDATIIVFLGVITFGLLHGINPSHGWTVAVLYSIRNKRPLLSSLTSSSILAGAHFLSSIVVVVAFIFVTMFVHISQTYLNYAVAAALGILAYLFWKEKGEDLVDTQHGHLHHDFIEEEQFEHEHTHWHSSTGNHTHLHLHQKRSMPTLAAIAGFALVLGFAHEEEFVILTLAAGGINPLLLMVAYATAVAVGLIGITVLAVKVYSYIEHRVIQYTKYLPKISALILAAMAVGFAARLL